MLTSQKISYEIGGNVEATPYDGIFAMHRLVTGLGLVKAIDAAVRLLKIHLPYHVLTLAYSVLTGGTRLEDVDRPRNDVPLMRSASLPFLVRVEALEERLDEEHLDISDLHRSSVV